MNPQHQNRIKSEHWKQHLEAWKTSGLSQCEYVRQQGLAIHAFRYWITKFNQPVISATTSLVKLPIQAQTGRESSLELIVNEKYRLIIRADFDSNLLQSVISSLESRPCS